MTDANKNVQLHDVLQFIGSASMDDIRLLHTAAQDRAKVLIARAGAQLGFGDSVTFFHKKHGKLCGRITGRSGRNVLVSLNKEHDNGITPMSWRISPSLLTVTK